MTTPLLPCPGCGSPAYLRLYRGIRCSNDACWWEIEVYGPNDESILTAQWNTRTPTPRETALTTAAQAVVEAYAAVRSDQLSSAGDVVRLGDAVEALAAALEKGV